MDQAHTTPRGRGMIPLLSVAVALVVGLAVAAVAASVSGAAGGLGALLGVGLVVVVCGLGGWVVAAATRISPAASLLVALMTYAAQIVVLLLALVALRRSGLLDTDLDRTWIGVGVICATVTWLAVQVRGAVTARIPAFDTTVEGGER